MDSVLEELDRLGAILLDRHFVYKSKKHGPHYINPDPMFPHVELSFEICSALADPYRILPVDTVASAATGGGCVGNADSTLYGPARSGSQCCLG